MKQAVYKHYGGGYMDSIDVHDLPEDQAQLLASFVEFLRERREALAQEKDWSGSAITSFAADWENNEDAIYDNWREHYHV